MKHKSPLSRLSSVLLIVGLLFLLLWPSFVQAVPLTVRQELLSAWQLAGEVGQYQYRSTVIQTTYPTAKLENVGRNPRTKRMIVEGTLDTPRDFMAMQLRNANPGTTQLIDLKVEDGLAYGRMETTANWQRLDDADQLFSPGSNPLGFLVAAENVQEIPPPRPEGSRPQIGGETDPSFIESLLPPQFGEGSQAIPSTSMASPTPATCAAKWKNSCGAMANCPRACA